jgi:hypothetical protein
MILEPEVDEEAQSFFDEWRDDWNKFARDVLLITLDKEQQEILYSVQKNRRTSVASGTARGKDYTAAAAALCFLYLTPVWEDGRLIENTKVAMTAPTDRQVGNIMFPEISRMWLNAVTRLPGKLVSYDIRTHLEEWFLTGFKADNKKPEAWTGFHASHTMFVVTEASGVEEQVFEAIEGNLQGDSRLLIVFNPNISTGYAARSQKSPHWSKIRLSSLTAPNVIAKRKIHEGQVDYEWVDLAVKEWTVQIEKKDYNVEEGDFIWEGKMYRPNDTFRKKVLGLFPKVDSDVLIPESWIELANDRWKKNQLGLTVDSIGNKGTPAEIIMRNNPLRLGVDVAGQGRDANAMAYRFKNYIHKFEKWYGKNELVHMETAGIVKTTLEGNTDVFKGLYAQAFIDTQGEGAGGYSRLIELTSERDDFGNLKHPKLVADRIHSIKYGEAAKTGDQPLKDMTGQRQFFNLKAYLAWGLREWLDPQNNFEPAIPPDEEFKQEATEHHYITRSNGIIQLEAKEDIKERIKRSPDKFDAVINTFAPVPDIAIGPTGKKNLARMFR